MPERSAGLRGRLPKREGDRKFAICWAQDYKSPPAPEYPIDISQGITDWQMLGNDSVGDCGPCGYEHDRMLAGATPTAKETEALYFDYTNSQDTGVVIADFLLWLYQQGHIEGFAPVESHDVDAVMAQFQRGILLGVSLTDDANALFNEGKPWTVTNGEQPDPAEGHCILKTGSQGKGADGSAVTWGANQIIEGAWQAVCVDEAWVILTADDMGDAAYAQLVADLDALPHATNPPPVTPPPIPDPVPPVPVPPTPVPEPPAPTPPPEPPAPTPLPIPFPPPAPNPHELIREIEHIVEEAIAKIHDAAVAWIRIIEGK